MNDQEPTPLTQSEFGYWHRGLDQKIDHLVSTMEKHIEAQIKTNLTVESRLSTVEAGEVKNSRMSVSGIVTAVITGIAAAFSLMKN